MGTFNMWMYLLLAFAGLHYTVAGLSTGDDCVLMCTDIDGVAIPDGDYLYCWSCHKYVECTAGKEKYKKCPKDETWNDETKQCELGNSTCSLEKVAHTGDMCIESCEGRHDGFYQACDSCDHYIQCNTEQSNMVYCGMGAFWDDIKKACKKRSKTCMEPQTDHPHEHKKLNILFILADDLGWNDIGYHNPEFHTPYLDYMAKNGRRLNHLYYQPGCTPSRFALMTGYYPFKGGMQHFILAGGNPHCVPLDLEFLPQKLKKHGYSTHIMGKWHIGFCQKACTPTQRGFDTFMGMYGGQGDQFTHESQPPDPILYDWRNNLELDFSANGTHITDLLNDHAIELIRNMEEDEHFFMILTHTVPHHPLQAPEKYLEYFPHETNHERKMVKAMMAHLDDRTKDLVRVLKEKGFYDNTLIIFTSDNGGDIGAHHDNSPLRGAKGSLYEGGTRVVGFVHGPMVENPGTVHDGLIHVTDLHATILSLAGVDEHHDLDGVDQSEMLLKGRETKRPDLIYNIDLHEPAYFGHTAYRDHHYKIIWGYVGYADGYGLDGVPTQDSQESLDFLKKLDPVKFGEFNDSDEASTERLMALLEATKIDITDKNSGAVRLYNLDDDPAEEHDLSEDPQYKGRIRQMKQKIISHYMKGFSPPPAESTQFWIPEAFAALERHSWAHGWCEDLQLDRIHKHLNYVDTE